VPNPLVSAAKAAVRPETYPGHARELASLVITAAVWPFGVVDHGLAELRRRAGGEEPTGRAPVLLVHGFAANKSNWTFLRRDLRAAGFDRVDALNYNPFTTDVPGVAAAAVRRARDLMAATGSDRVHLVGHSLGGIVARYAVQLGGLTEAASCVTVASPHQGVAVARLARWPLAAAQLGPDSAVLTRLRASSRRLDTRFVAYYSNLDLLVPGHRAMLLEPALRATNVLVRDEGHLSILLSRRFAGSLLRELVAADERPARAAAAAAA
jgi:triacylglycerol lipase